MRLNVNRYGYGNNRIVEYQHCFISCLYCYITKEEIMPNYSSQQKHLRSNYVRFPLDLKPEVLQQFKDACNMNGTTPTTEIKKFINEYIKANVTSNKAGE